MEDSRLIQEENWLLKEKYGGFRSYEFILDRERLRRGEPLAYLIGWVPFSSVKVWLDSRPLIPRSETEFWVQEAVAEIRKYARTNADAEGIRVLDLGAGSGCIGLAVAKALPETRVDFAEIDPAHHAAIEKSAATNGIDARRLRIFGGDLFAELPPGSTYDFILSNPPYIDPSLDRAEESVRAHEPHRALYGGAGGLEIISRIIAAAPAHLRGGALYLEHEPEQSAAIAAYAKRAGMTTAARRDQYGIERYSILRACAA
jgi:release factor glutamine methyltransferase